MISDLSHRLQYIFIQFVKIRCAVKQKKVSLPWLKTPVTLISAC